MKKSFWSKGERRANCICHFGSDDFVIDGITFNAVHEFPTRGWNENQEIDFYMDDGNDIFMLRVINNKSNTVTFYDNGMIVDIVIETHLCDGTMEEFAGVVNLLRRVHYDKSFRCKRFEKL